MEAESPICWTSCCAAPDVDTSSATISRSRISCSVAEGIATRIIPLFGQTSIGSYGLRFKYIQPDLFDSGVEVEHTGCAVAQVHDPTLNKGAAVVDSDDDRFPVAQIGDLDVGTQGKLAVGGGESEHVEVLAAGGGSAVELLAIPRGIADLVRFGYFVTAFCLNLGYGVIWNWSRPHAGNQKTGCHQNGQYAVHS